MSFSESRSTTVKVSASASFFFNNLVSSADGVAYAHLDQIAILRSSAWDARTDAAGAPLELLPASRSGVTVTSLAWVPSQASLTELLAVTTYEELLIYKAPGSAGAVFVQQPLLAVALDSLPAPVLGSRAPSAHFFRGIAAVRAASLLYVGTSWGDVLVWSTRPTSNSSPIDGFALRGVHSKAISAIAADDNFIVTGDDAGVVAMWAAPLSDCVVGGGATAAAPTPIVRHEMPGSVPCTSVGLLLGDAVVAAFANGVIRIFSSRGARSLAVEVVAHAVAVTAITTHATAPTFASVGDDGVVNVWTLPELLVRRSGGAGSGAGGVGVGPLVLGMTARSASLHCGVAFFSPPSVTKGDVLVTAAYDAKSLLCFKEL